MSLVATLPGLVQRGLAVLVAEVGVGAVLQEDAGDLGTALAEMETLPEAARAAMDDWLQAASARKAAQDAASDLADSLNSN